MGCRQRTNENQRGETWLSATLVLLFFVGTLQAQVKVTRVYPYTSGDKGVIYYLPKTELQITFTILKSTFFPGEFASYADVLLGRKAVEDKTETYEVLDVSIAGKGVPDETQCYSVEFRPQTPASYVSVTHEGLLAGINTEWHPLENAIAELPEEHDKLPEPFLPIEFAEASSRAMRAKVAAETLFLRREEIMALMAGNASNVPTDGETYRFLVSRLQQQVDALEALFYGTTRIESSSETIRLEPPLTETTLSIAQFSPERGFSPRALGSDNYKVVLKYSPTLTVSPEEEEKKDGLVYNIPGEARVKVQLPDGKSFEALVPVTQLGTQVLFNRQINKNKSNPVTILFDPDTGRILNVNGL